MFVGVFMCDHAYETLFRVSILLWVCDGESGRYYGGNSIWSLLIDEIHQVITCLIMCMRVYGEMIILMFFGDVRDSITLVKTHGFELRSNPLVGGLGIDVAVHCS